MSDYESHVGKLRKVDLEDKTIEEFFEQKCKEDGIEWDEYLESWEEVYDYHTDNYYKYLVVNDVVWEVFDRVKLDCIDGVHIVDNKDGTYSFNTTFYNGGASLGEVLEDAIEEL